MMFKSNAFIQFYRASVSILYRSVFIVADWSDSKQSHVRDLKVSISSNRFSVLFGLGAYHSCLLKTPDKI